MTDQSVAPTEISPYRVLARKYRPTTFADLIGQEAMVRTLTNAIETNRLAHAFILTGVRGVGKTTTARIIARALNYTGPDGSAGPTIGPTDDCPICQAIAEDRHPDVIEMDAASRTGVNDIRELIDGVRYRPVEARYKVYIIDEVHMLSTNAFNALLKTLEEPPEHVIFIFATTEIRKVPVTILSRCQRFDLRRVGQEDLAEHFMRILEKEGVAAGQDAVAMIARAADGSVRDGLSLLDQAIALGGGKQIEAAQVGEMLGLADRSRIFDLFDAVMRGAVTDALAILEDLHAAGADPAVMLEDLLGLTHFLTRAKLVPESLSGPDLPEAERDRGRAMAERLTLPTLARAWQMLLRGLEETRFAPAPRQSVEMVLIRLAYASELPAPADLVERLRAVGPGRPAASVPAPAADPLPGGQAAPVAGRAVSAPTGRGETALAHDLAADPAEDLAPRAEQLHPAEVAAPPAPLVLTSLQDVVTLARRNREGKLANQLMDDVQPVAFEPGRIELRPLENAPRDLAGQLGRLLQEWTGSRWVVALSSDASAAPTLRDQARAAEAQRRAELADHPIVKAALQEFPDAEIAGWRSLDRPADKSDTNATDRDPEEGEGLS